ncbi:MAG: lysophospholipid acyltransferase family protein [Acidimicrobiales bacterium]
MSVRLPRVVDEVVSRPTWPGTLPRPMEPRNLGVDYDTAWTRKPWARAVRRLLVDNVTRPFVALVAKPQIFGREHLDPLVGPVIFAANHTSHLDTSIVVACLPERFRRRTVVAAAADYFFDRPWKAAMWSLALGTIPMERTKVNRKSADLAASLLEQRWNLVIFPEGGRSQDGWGREFRGGAAYLAKRCDVAVVPVHLRGVRPVFPKGASKLRPGKVEVRFGDPLWPGEVRAPSGKEEDARRFAARIEESVALLADEAETDWWSARRRAAAGETPDFRGPDASPWRRAWALPASARRTRSPRARSSAKPW